MEYGTVIDYRIGQARHVASPHTVWMKKQKELWVYVHAPNSQTIVCRSKDGIHFQYGTICVKAIQLQQATGYNCKAASYARVYDYVPPQYHGDHYSMSISAAEVSRQRIHARKKIVLCTSPDGWKWKVRKVILDDGQQGRIAQTLDAFWYFENGKHYFLYSLRSRSRPFQTPVHIHRTELDTAWNAVQYQGIFYPSQPAPDRYNARGAFYLPVNTQFIYESGPQLGATIALA